MDTNTISVLPTTKKFVDLVYELYSSINTFIAKTPLICSSLAENKKLFLKCENLQHTHSFKFRAAFAGLFMYKHYHPKIWKTILKEGIVTCSTGNFAMALAYITKEYGLKLTVIIHEWVDKQKIESILQYNPQTQILNVPMEDWKDAIIHGKFGSSRGFFLCPETNDYLTLGNATLGIEILDQCPDIESVVIPYGGGNLTYSLGTFLKQVRPNINIYTAEVSSGAPFAASLKAGKPQNVHYEKSFVDGIGADFVIPLQFERVRPLVKRALVVMPQEIAKAISQLAIKDKIITEGAGAASVAAYLKFGISQRTCCILSGGNIDGCVLADLLSEHSVKTSVNPIAVEQAVALN